MTWFSLPFHRMFLRRLKKNRRKHPVIKMTENTCNRDTTCSLWWFLDEEFMSPALIHDQPAFNCQLNRIRTAAGYGCKFSDGITTVLEIIQFGHQVTCFTGHELAYKAFWFSFSSCLLTPGVETARLWSTAKNFQPKPRTSNISKYIMVSSEWCLAFGFVRGNII